MRVLNGSQGCVQQNRQQMLGRAQAALYLTCTHLVTSCPHAWPSACLQSMCLHCKYRYAVFAWLWSGSESEHPWKAATAGGAAKASLGASDPCCQPSVVQSGSATGFSGLAHNRLTAKGCTLAGRAPAAHPKTAVLLVRQALVRVSCAFLL
jgi:hypothetical protein